MILYSKFCFTMYGFGATVFSMARHSKHDIKLKALRAAAGVALFSGAIGCGTVDTDTLEASAAVSDAGAQLRDAGAIRDGGFRDGGFVDAGFADAGFTMCDNATQSVDEYVACCEAIGWDWDRGCAAWGPPAPPTMTEVA